MDHEEPCLLKDCLRAGIQGSRLGHNFQLLDNVHISLTFYPLPQGQVCTKCGSILSPLLDKPAVEVAAAAAHKERKWTCKVCESTEHIQLLAFPYVFRYLVAELAAMNIKVALDVKRVGSE